MKSGEVKICESCCFRHEGEDNAGDTCGMDLEFDDNCEFLSHYSDSMAAMDAEDKYMECDYWKLWV